MPFKKTLAQLAKETSQQRHHHYYYYSIFLKSNLKGIWGIKVSR